MQLLIYFVKLYDDDLSIISLKYQIPKGLMSFIQTKLFLLNNNFFQFIK